MFSTQFMIQIRVTQLHKNDLAELLDERDWYARISTRNCEMWGCVGGGGGRQKREGNRGRDQRLRHLSTHSWEEREHWGPSYLARSFKLLLSRDIKSVVSMSGRSLSSRTGPTQETTEVRLTREFLPRLLQHNLSPDPTLLSHHCAKDKTNDDAEV